MRIRFVARHVVAQGDRKGPVYEAGQSYDFEGRVAETYARKYVSRGWAVVEPSAPASAPVAAEPLPPPAQPPEPATAAEPVPSADAAKALLASLKDEPAMNFLVFRAAAEKIIGPTIPAKKAEILAALQALAGEPAE
ncbi:MAG: hypothetical protein AB7F22_10565 [Reyranella sp.]|uniref:hypothetical protein n=1 Tax=Reyranella sp. TaxID=1929291 RepID=UPI003D1241B3